MASVYTIEEISSLDPEQLVELAHAMSRDTQLFAEVVMSHVVRDVPDFHKDLYSYFNMAKGNTRSIKYIAAVLFRGAAKSTLKTFDSLHDICHAIEPVSLYLSEAEDQSIRDLISVQDEIVSNDMLRALYGDLKGTNLWNRTECEFANGCYLAAKGWRSKVRGIKWKMQRPTKLWLDDFEGEANTKTDEARTSVSEWVEKQVMPAGDVDPTIIMLGTIVHPDSYLASIKDLDIFTGSQGVYYEKAISENVDGTGAAWPRRYPTEWIQAKRRYYEQRGNLSYFLQEYYNIPSQISAPKFQMDLVQEITGGKFEKYANVTYIKTGQRKIPINVFIGVDVASTLHEKSDRTVLFVLGILPGNKHIILDIYADKIDFVHQINKVFEYVERYKPRAVTVETYNYQQSLVDWLRHEMQQRKQPFAINEFKENKSKSVKYLEGLCPIINTGKLGYVEDCPNIDIYFREGRAFSGGEAEHDDTLDAHFLAEINAYAPPQYDVDARIERLKKLQKSKDEKLGRRKLTAWTI